MNEIFSRSSINNNNNNGIGSGKIKSGGMVNVCGIILAGNGPLKSQLYQSPFLKHYILASVMSIIDINYGGKFGFDETIRKCADVIKQKEFESENKLIETIFGLLAEENNTEVEGNVVAIGFDETLRAIELNVVKYVVISCGYYKFAVKLMGNDNVMKAVKFAKNEIEVGDISKEMLNERDENKCSANSDSIKVVSFSRFFDKLCVLQNIELKIVGMHSPLTQQFAKGFSGCVAVLHYPINFLQNNDESDYYSD